MNILYLMMAVLKFIGIALLIICLILLLTITIILIVPIEYKFHINKGDTIYANTYISWLYSIVGLEVIHETNKTTVYYLWLFKKIFHSFKKEKSIKTQKHNHKTKEVRQEKKIKKVKKVKVDKPKTVQSKTKKNKAKSFIKQISAFEYKKELFNDTISWIKKLFKEILPHKLSIDLEIGRDNPADTGELMGILAMLYPFYYSVMNIRGNYEKECLYGVVNARGNIIFGKILYDSVKYIRTSSVKQMIKFIRTNRREKQDGRKATN